jgi:hypothetical protein
MLPPDAYKTQAIILPIIKTPVKRIAFLLDRFAIADS